MNAPKKAGPNVWKPAFLEALADTGNAKMAAEAVGISRDTVYTARNRSPRFREAMDKARAKAQDVLEAEAFRRAVDGVTEPVYYKGKIAGAVRKYSDALLIFLLKAADPAKYRERYSHEHTGAGGGPMQHAHEVKAINDALADPEIRASLDAIAERMEGYAGGDGG